MDGENRVYCEVCKCNMSSRKRMCAISQPDILILSLKRFLDLNTKIMKSVNLSRHVRYGDGKMYRLRSAIVHIGTSIRFGHYVTYTFDGKDRVVKFDDSIVRVMNENSFRNEVRGISTPYVALYVREDDVSAVDVRMSRDDARYVFRDHGKYLEEIGHFGTAKVDERKVPRIAPPVTSALGKRHRRHDDDDNDDMDIPREPRFGNFGGGSRFVC